MSTTTTPTHIPRPAWLVNLAILLLILAAAPLSHWLTALLSPRHYRYLNYRFVVTIRIGIAIILAVSLNLINGITGQFSLGHAGFMALGAYTCGVIMRQAAPQGMWLGPAILGLTILGGLVAAGAGVIRGCAVASLAVR